MIDVATDFGRTKKRSNADTIFSTSHDINNGNLVIWPMANGGKLLGGVRAYGTPYGTPPKNRCAKSRCRDVRRSDLRRNPADEGQRTPGHAGDAQEGLEEGKAGLAPFCPHL